MKSKTKGCFGGMDFPRSLVCVLDTQVVFWPEDQRCDILVC